MSSKLKNLFLLVLVIGIAYFGYTYFIKKDTPQTGLVSSSTQTAQTGGTALGDEFLALLLNLKVISLDSSIVETEPYQRLIDFTKVLSPDTNPGRPNPFAPIGTEGAIPVTPTPTTPQPTITPVPNGTQTPTTTTASVDTLAATSIQSISASLNGNLPQSSSGTTIWFEYGLSSQNLTISTARSQQNLLGAFATPVSGLRSATTYYFRAAATINGKTVYGQTLSFKTR